MKRMRIQINLKKRQKLPNSAFAYVDPDTGQKYLPIINKVFIQAAIMAVMCWGDNDPAKKIAMIKIENQAKKFGMQITAKRWKIPKESWSVS